MALKKFTTLQLNGDARVAMIRASSSPVAAKLSDFEFQALPGFLYVTTRAISSRVNANFDGWPPEELRKSFKTFIGRPVYVDHNNWDLKRSRGVIIDAKLYESTLSNGDEDVSVHQLHEIDARAFPKLAERIISGDIDSVSMGADVEYTICSVCGNQAHDVLQYCGHVPQMKGREIDTFDKVAGRRIKKLCYEDCFGISFFETSYVFDPADESALISDVMFVPAAENRALSHIIRPQESIAAYSERLGTSLTKVASTKQSDKVLMSLPQEVDTLRDELNCPQCGAEWNGMVCLGCGFEMPPEGLGDPDTEPMGMAMPGQPGGGAEQDQDKDGPPQPKDKGSDDKSKDAPKKDDSKASPKSKDDKSKAKDDKKSPAKEKKSGQKEERVSRFEDLQKQATLPQDPPYRQDTSPAESVPPYGQAIPGGNEPEGVEQALEPAPSAKAVVQDLDAPDVQGQVGQSEVDVVSQPAGPTTTPGPGTQVGESVNRAASKEEDQRGQFYRLRAAELHARADEFEKKAETITQTDVRNLDEPPAVDVGPDATADVLKATDEHEQLALADTTDVINDGSETGLPAVRDRLNKQVNPFNDAALQGYAPVNQQVASVESAEEQEIAKAAEARAREDQRVAAAKTRVLRVANFVDERIKMGLTAPDDKFGDIARFEEMDDATLDGYVQATREFKAKEIRTASKRISVSAGDNGAIRRMPSLGSASRPAEDEDDVADDYVAFM